MFGAHSFPHTLYPNPEFPEVFRWSDSIWLTGLRTAVLGSVGYSYFRCTTICLPHTTSTIFKGVWMVGQHPARWTPLYSLVDCGIWSRRLRLSLLQRRPRSYPRLWGRALIPALFTAVCVCILIPLPSRDGSWTIHIPLRHPPFGPPCHYGGQPSKLPSLVLLRGYTTAWLHTLHHTCRAAACSCASPSPWASLSWGQPSSLPSLSAMTT